jgi:uncharacterized protein (DUF2141 family)
VGTLLAIFAVEAGEQSHRLTIEIDGLKSNAGKVAFAVFDSKEPYDRRSDPLRSTFLPVVDRGCGWVVEDLPTGRYAVMVFHDRNDNGELDKRPLGIPKEPYGFSNDARDPFGPPSFEDAAILVDGDLTIEVRLR